MTEILKAMEDHPISTLVLLTIYSTISVIISTLIDRFFKK